MHYKNFNLKILNPFIKKMNIPDLIIQIIHIFILGIFLLYVGIMIPCADWNYYILFIFGLVALLFFIINIREEKLFWVLWHVLIIGIILIWVGIQKSDSPQFLFRLLIILGSAAIGYHSIRMIQNIKNKTDT